MRVGRLRLLSFTTALIVAAWRWSRRFSRRRRHDKQGRAPVVLLVLYVETFPFHDDEQQHREKESG